jgi:WD40 repeat protein/tRNA A-37 threonylcarbamoyl transferase component Bud32
MAVAEAHPSAEELAAFTLGTLDDEAQASIEAHVEACTSCQERAAVVPGDSLVELLRRLDARADGRADTFREAAAHVQTPVLFEAVAETDSLASAVAPAAPAESGRPEISDAIPPELAHHERYRVLRLIGAGGMGVVYEAEHRVMRRRVAVKIIRRDYTANPNALERFRGEVQNAARLSHPNIVTTYDAEDAGETHFLVMEYVEGTDLGQLVQERGPLPVDRACDYVRQAALGLQYAFEQNMVHRDLKPHNLMLTPDGRVKILDFGLARFASETASIACPTGSDIVLGTADYIAPEQAENAHDADIRSDIYSLGCTLYHLVAGQPPFPTGTPLQKVMAHVKRKPQPLTELRQNLPEGLMPVLERMMAKNPKDRYQTPAEVAFALEPFTLATAVARQDELRQGALKEGDSGTLVLEKSPAYRRRWRGIVALAAALLFVSVGLLGVAVYRIATDQGELVIETDNEDVEVVVRQNGKEVKIIDTKTGKHITLNSGDYELALKEGQEGLKLSPDKMTLKRGETVLATIQRVTKPVAEQVGEIRRFEGHTKGAGGVAFSPDGRYALSGAGDGTVRLWEVATGREVRQFSGHSGAVDDVAFSSDGRQALTASHDGTVRLWDVHTGKVIHVLIGHTGVHRVVFSPDGRRALSGGGEGTMRLWDLDSGREVRRFTGWCGVAFSPDGRRALSGEGSGHIGLWDVETGAGVRQLLGHRAGVTSVVFLPGGRQALSCSHDQTLRLWDLASGEEIRVFSGHTGAVQRVAITPDGRCAVSAGDKTVRVWDLQTGKEIHCFTGHTEGLIGVAVSPDGRYALSGSGDGTMRLWRLPDLPPAEKVGEVRRFEGHTDCVWGVALSPDGRYALSAGSDARRLWDLRTGLEIRSYPGHSPSVAFLPNGREFLSCSGDHTMRHWQIETGKQLHSADLHDMLYDVAVSPDGLLALVTHQDKTLHLWDLKNWKEIRRFEGHTEQVQRVVFSADGRHALSGAWDKTARLWDVETGTQLKCFMPHQDYVMGVALSPDGRSALSGSGSPDGDGELILWDIATEKELRRFKGHKGRVEGVAFSPDGRYALSGGEDHSVRLWEVATGKELRRFDGHQALVWSVVFSHDGRYALSSSHDRTVRLWRLPDLPPAEQTP